MKLDRQKIIIGLGGILGLLILLILLTNLLSFRNIKEGQINKKLISGLSKDQIVKLEIRDYSDAFTVEKNDKKWSVKTEKGFVIPGNETKIGEYLDTLVNLTQGKVVDNKKDATTDRFYGFDEFNYQKLTITLKNNKNYTLLLGNPGSQQGTSFVRYGDEKKVREIKTMIASGTSNEPVQWAERNIFEPIKTEDIQTVEIAANFDFYKGGYTVSYQEPAKDKKDEKGKFKINPAPADPIDEFALETLLRTITTMQIAEYKYEGTVDGREKIGSIKIVLRDQKKFNIDIYQADSTDIGNFIIKAEHKNYLYLIHEDLAKRLFKNPLEMVQKPQ